MAIAFDQILEIDAKLFAKSEFGPANSDWPALSFSSNKIARDFQAIYRRGRDFVIYVGTSNPTDTPEAGHRQRLLSVVDIEPHAIVQTRQIVSAESWARAQARYPGRWDVSLRMARAWEVIGFPRAHDLLPATYALFQNPGTRGHPIPLIESDLVQLRALQLNPIDLALTDRAVAVLGLNVDDAQLRRELSRLTDLIQRDIAGALTERGGTNPLRTGGNYSDVFAMLSRLWNEQNGRCVLCGTPIPLITANKLLKMSRDRIDSANKSYEVSNVQITHFGCNMAKSDATMDEWREFRVILGQQG
jgi:hypothetical protein